MLRKCLNRLRLTQQWVGATLLALLPLTAAVLYGGWSISTQSQNQRLLVAHLQRVGRIEANILERVTGVERSARQYNLLRNPKFLTFLQNDLSLLGEDVAKLQQTLPQALKQTEQFLAASQGLLMAAEADTATLASQLQNLKDERDQLVVYWDSYTLEQLNQAEALFNDALKRLWIIGILALPGTLLLVTLSVVAVGAPLRRLAGAIHDLGHARWQRPIAIEGPKDLRELGENLEWMRLRLVLSDKQKQAFLQHITHELKAPLAAITEASRLLNEQLLGPTTPGQVEVIRILLNNADSLHELIQQLLNYNAVTQGLVADLRRFDLRAVSEKLCSKITDSRPNSRCTWLLLDEAFYVHSDLQIISMILDNLLSNAHDFSGEHGKVTLSWGEGPQNWWLSVADNGPGIGNDELDKVFKPFYQGRTRRHGSLKGSGMGLAIVAACTKLLAGKLKVSSTLKKGTRFTVHFPKNPEIFHEPPSI
ncbi:MAG: HAMP domain-containing histidine kinase [Moraxellaceae bacterium]|nr:MAG: HAMP domain-containing histidine kinase [Moraxellaceae bacterium]